MSMRCPSLSELPPPPPGKTGWPWAEESPQLPDRMPDGQPWPKISIVTPSLNQGQFIEETIRSVLLQGYPNLEYIIIDGESKDGAVQIIKKYSKWLTFWVSEPDKGQAHGINKGWKISSGSLLGWLNSDDLLLPRAFRMIGIAHRNHPNSLIVGDVINFNTDSDRNELIKQYGVTFSNIVGDWRARWLWHQPGIYFPRNPLMAVGLLDESLHLSFDFDLLCRILQQTNVHYLRIPIAKFRIHPYAKTQLFSSEKLKEEMQIVYRRYADKVPRAKAFWAVKDGMESLRKGQYKDGLEILIKGIRAHFLGATIDIIRMLINLL